MVKESVAIYNHERPHLSLIQNARGGHRAFWQDQLTPYRPKRCQPKSGHVSPLRSTANGVAWIVDQPMHRHQMCQVEHVIHAQFFHQALLVRRYGFRAQVELFADQG